jgi:secreted Zn-dependent insulinase-like peptidase
MGLLQRCDMNSTQAAAAMSVNVGSFSNPEGLEGLAHFLGTNSCAPECCYS